MTAHAAVREEDVSAFEKFLPIFEELTKLEEERNAAPSALCGTRRRSI
jgi:hypothetical protein